MSTKHDESELHRTAGGWIAERRGTPVPAFLKLAYVGFCASGFWYLFACWLGETSHPTRAALAAEIDRAFEAPATWWHVTLAVILAGFVAGLLWFTFLAEDAE